MHADKQFNNEVAIVTGGSEGIGFGIACALAEQGAHVYLVARTEEKLRKAQDQIARAGGKADIRVADITDLPAMQGIIQTIYAENKRLDIFVNNAGSWKGQTVDTSFSEIEKLLKLDFIAPYALAHFLAQTFHGEKDNHLRVLTVASQASLQVMDLGLGYGPAKMGLTAGLMHLAHELRANKHIAFYNLFPNTVATDNLLPAIREGKVQNPVRLSAVVDTAIDLLVGKTPTTNARVGYYPGRGIVRSYLPSDAASFYKYAPTLEVVVDAHFTPNDL